MREVSRWRNGVGALDTWGKLSLWAGKRYVIQVHAVLHWVYEFYAKASIAEGGTVYVRGKKVNFSTAAINSLFDLDDNIVPDHTSLLSTMPMAELIVVVCSALGPDWVNTKENALKSTCLSREARVWLYFVNTSLLPTRHLNHVQLDRIALIFCIIKGIKVNIGRIISRLIWTKVNDKKNEAYLVPHHYHRAMSHGRS
ncbi:hypothetical protein KSP40_PGU000798 [Platanthera guangdongensis]|uniref:Putative plant transposon protein domain-containing protein n=1 Tax=Platanthera guangdongensis TaxID=2320717 RepID=A0ABR2MIR9_9ASPA